MPSQNFFLDGIMENHEQESLLLLALQDKQD
jgi:hypothetical protein